MVHFLRGLADLEAGDPEAAVAANRRAICADPDFGLAAFQLGRSYETLGNPRAAGRAYEQALRALRRDDTRHDSLLEQVELGDVRTAAQNRLEALAAVENA